MKKEKAADPIEIGSEERDEETKKEEKQEGKATQENAERDGFVTTGEIATVTIIGQIEGHYVLDSTQKTTKYEHLIPMLISMEQDSTISAILLILNTMGGDVEAGLALAEMIASLTKPTASIVLGGGHSIGIPLAVCADHTFIVESATMTIHPVRSSGTIIGVPQSFYYFERMQERILDFIVGHCKADKEALRALMMNTDEIANDVGSIIDGQQAVQLGMIDEIGGIGSALSYLHSRIQRKRKGTAPQKNTHRTAEAPKKKMETQDDI